MSVSLIGFTRSQVARPSQNSRGRSEAAARQCSVSTCGMLCCLSPPVSASLRTPVYAVSMVFSLAVRMLTSVYVTRAGPPGSLVFAS